MVSKVDRLHSSAESLADQFERGGGDRCINEAIDHARQALDLCLQDSELHSKQSVSLTWLANHLKTRFSRLDGLKDLDEAIDLGNKALNLCPPGHPDRSMSLNNLAIDLFTRYIKLGAPRLDDLDKAVELGHDILRLHPPGHPLRLNSLANLVTWRVSLYNQHRKPDDLDEVIKLGREALNLCPLGHPLRLRLLNYLANSLKNRYMVLQQETDQEELFRLYCSLKDMQQITSLDDFFPIKAWITAAEELEHSSVLLAYETALRLLINHLVTLPPLSQELLANIKDLTSELAANAFSAAIRNRDSVSTGPTRAIELLEQGHGTFWSQLAWLHPSPDNRDVAASESVGNVLTGRLSRRIRDAAHFTGPDQHDKPISLSVKLQRAISEGRQLSHLSPFPHPPHFSHLRQAAVSGPVIIVNASAYSCDAVVVLLEQDPVHVPLPAVTKNGTQDLSSKFRTLMRTKSTNISKDLRLFLRELWDKVVSPVVDILQHIAHPLQSRIWWLPTAEFTSLPLHAAGPYRNGEQNLSDLYVSSYTPTLSALIHARPHVQPKPERQTENEHPVSASSSSPVRLNDPPNPEAERPPEHLESHSGIFSKMRSRRHDPQDTEQKGRGFSRPRLLSKRPNSLKVKTPHAEDSAVAANTSQGEAVSVSREAAPVGPKKATAQRVRFVAIGYAKATGESELGSTSSELADIGQRVNKFAAFTRIEGSESCISRVVKELGHNQWVHFACHGIANEKQPFDSGFALYDGCLTIKRIIQCKLENPEFAYLSACHTTPRDEESPDEVVSLAAAMQFVGFRSVIGSMWAVDDDQASKVTSTFYKYMVDGAGHLDYTRAALALHQTMEELKDVVPIDQRILYVHIGA